MKVTTTALRAGKVWAVVAIVGLMGCANPNSMVAGNVNSAVKDAPLSGIIGGTVSTGSEPFARSTVMLYDTLQGALCSGSLLSDKILISAAHCVASSPKALKVIFTLSLDALKGMQKAQIASLARQVTAFETTPAWATHQNNQTNTGDLSIVAFAGGIPAGYGPAVISKNRASLVTGGAVLLAGYGIENGVTKVGAGTLRSVQTTILNAAFSETEFTVQQDAGVGACHGDSGGPAFLAIGGRLALAGVTSRGIDDPNNDCSVAAAYTSVAAYLPWIQATAKKLAPTATAPQQPAPGAQPAPGGSVQPAPVQRPAAPMPPAHTTRRPRRKASPAA